MNEQNDSAPDSTPLRLPDPPGPPGASVDRPPAPAGTRLQPGAGSPVQPGPPMSVQAPINDTTLNMSALVLWASVAILALIVLVILIAVFTHR